MLRLASAFAKTRFVVAALTAALAGGTIFVACSNQGEGERCDHLADNGGNDDCQDGLICYLATSLNGPPNGDRCCPVDRTTATTAVCSLAQTPPGTDAAPPPAVDAGGGSDAGDDGATADSATPDDGATSDAAMTMTDGAPPADASGD